MSGEPVEHLPGVVGYTLDIGEGDQERLRAGEHKMWAGQNELAARAAAALDAVRPKLREAGGAAVDLGQVIGCGPARRFVGLFPTDDPYAIVAAVGTFGNDDGVKTPDIIAWMRETAAAEPWELVGCGRATLDLRFPEEVRDPVRLAERMKALCSDVGQSGAEALAADLARTRRASFWWD